METIRILHIENADIWGNIVSRYCAKRREIRLTQVRTIREAAGLVQSETYDLIFADLLMSNEENDDVEQKKSPRELAANAIDDFSKLMFELGMTVGGNSFDHRPPIVIITAMPIIEDDIRGIVNKYPGWIWGWIEKATMSEDEVFNAIDELTRYRNRIKQNLYSGSWPGGLSQLLVYAIGFWAIWLVFSSTSQNDNIALKLLFPIVALALVITTQAFFLRSNRQLSDESYQSVIIEIVKQVVGRQG